jgi:hypothetical protein
MLTFDRRPSICAIAASLALLALPVPAAAFDREAADREERSPWAVFQFGYTAYQKGDKGEAVQAYRYAAEKGHSGALWKLGRMYADGDGVSRDDYQAFRFFEQVVSSNTEAGSPDESYLVDALLAMARYLRTGIPETPVTADRNLAQDLYMRAATFYGDPRAQFEMASMLLEEKDLSGKKTRQAARWLRLAAAKGHAGAQATLGNLLFQSGNAVDGLAMLTAALERSQPSDRAWIAKLQEEAFALAREDERRSATELAANLLKSGN